jgi:hypothetical protein
MLAIGQHDFFIGEALLVVKNGDNFTVVEGNRRLTSLKLLSNPSLMVYPYKLFAIICISCLFNSGGWTSIAFHALKYEIVLMTLLNLSLLVITSLANWTFFSLFGSLTICPYLGTVAVKFAAFTLVT